jgi:acetolactate synthase-1/2/3 large subunit
MSYKGLTGAKAISNILLDVIKAKHIFGYSGGSIISVFNEIDNRGMKCYIGTHEQSCCHAAVGYAKSSNKIGVCISTSGPGVTNMVTPVYDAMCDGVPLLVLSGQVPLSVMGTGAFQECPAVDIMRNVTKFSYCIKEVNEIPKVLHKALNIATSGRKGPVHIDLPKNILNDIITEEYMFEDTKTENIKNNEMELKEQIDKTICMIKKSKRPIFIVGQGCSEYYELIRKIAIDNDIYVTTTLLGNGIMDQTHKLTLKFPGMHGNIATNKIIQKADVIVGVGYRFDDRTIGNPNKYAITARTAFNEGTGGIINCNIKGMDFNRTVRTHVNVECDAKIFLEELIKHNLKNERKKWNAYIEQQKEKHKFTFNKTNELKVQDIIVEINNYLLENKTDFMVTTGVGNHQMMTSQYIDWRKPKQMITSGSLGVMGVGLPYAIGAHLANPNILIIDIDGDGSFNHTLSELKTIATYNIPIKIAVMNDKSQSMVQAWERIFYGKNYISTDNKYNPVYYEMANAFGIHSIFCDNKCDLKKKIKQFLEHKGPILCDFICKGEVCLPFVAPGMALEEQYGENIDEMLAPS